MIIRFKNRFINKRYKPKILIRFYDSVNLGDDLFLKIFAERYKDADLYLPVYNNSKTVIPQNIHKIRLFLKRKWLSGLGVILGIANPQLITLMYLMKYDAMVYVGGSIFIETHSLRKWYSEKKFYNFLPQPYYILGSNFGPYQTQEFKDIIHSIVKGAADVCFRDKASYGIFKDVPNARVATDIAFTLDSSIYKAKTQKYIVFSIIDGRKKFNEGVADAYERKICELTMRLIRDGYKVVYMSFCKYEGDESANMRALARLPSEISRQVEVYNYDGNLDEALSIIAKSEIMVASRFHATILGLVFGKKVLPMAYSDKTTNILSDMKFPGQVVDIRKIEDFDSNAVDFDAIPIMDISEQIKLAEKQFQELDKVLTKK